VFSHPVGVVLVTPDQRDEADKDSETADNS
jgi:hypothetical protein